MKLNDKLTHVLVVGGGRWARVLVEAIADIVPARTMISIYSVHNADKMSLWALEKNFKQTVFVYKNFSRIDKKNINAAVVVNAARSHAPITERIIQLGVPVLVEKPVTLSYEETTRLVGLANEKKVIFSAAHVFMYATYLSNFSQLVAACQKVYSIHVDWFDPKLEHRHGELKQYDPSLPIFYDWLPHVLSIITVVKKGCLIEQSIDVQVHRGGSHVEVEFMMDDTACHVRLIRNSEIRRRSLKIISDKVLKLDFSNEPGVIYDTKNTYPGDENWNKNKHPVSKMLAAYLNQASGLNIDDRLDIEVALQANKLIDGVADLYNQSLLCWLKDRLISPVLLDSDLEYALTEIISLHEPPNINIGGCIENIRQMFDSENANFWRKCVLESGDPYKVIKSIALSNSC